MEQKLHSWFFCFMVRVDIELWLRLRDRKVTTDTRNRKKRRPKDRCVNLFFTSQCDGAIVRATFYQFAMRPHLLYRNSRSQQEREREIPSIMHTQHLRFSRFFIALRCWFPLNRHDRRLHIYIYMNLSLSLSLLCYRTTHKFDGRNALRTFEVWVKALKQNAGYLLDRSCTPHWLAYKQLNSMRVDHTRNSISQYEYVYIYFYIFYYLCAWFCVKSNSSFSPPKN